LLKESVDKRGCCASITLSVVVHSKGAHINMDKDQRSVGLDVGRRVGTFRTIGFACPKAGSDVGVS
jgi:hypothetical protein